MEFDHINITSSITQLEKEKRFWCEVFDLKQGFRPQFSMKGFWLYAGERAIVHLTERGSDTDNKQSALHHVAFQMSDLKNFIQRLEQLNIDYIKSRIETMNITQIFITSPLGIKVESVFRESV